VQNPCSPLVGDPGEWGYRQAANGNVSGDWRPLVFVAERLKAAVCQTATIQEWVDDFNIHAPENTRLAG
jgi:hypothetical protein